MAIIWALRSDNANFSARYSEAGLVGTPVYTSVANIPTYGADATAIGGNSFSLDRGSATSCGLVYPARGVFSNQAISILMRLKLAANGTFGLFEINPGSTWLANSYLMYMVSNWCLNIVNQTPATVRSSTLYNTAPSTDVWLDMVVTWDGSATAGSVKFWLDGSNVVSVNPSAAASNPKNANTTSMINIGGVTGAPTTRFLLNEFVIWDEVIDPTAVALVGGTDSLEGADRTAFVDVATYDGTASSGSGSNRNFFGRPKIG